MLPSKQVFVTVGSTRFDALIQAVDSRDALDALIIEGFTQVLLQIGKGSHEPNGSGLEIKPLEDGFLYRSLTVRYYRFKNSLDSDMRSSALVISHAGAGTILQGLRMGARLIVVINTSLMDNHQIEIARELGEKHYLQYGYPSDVCSLVSSSASFPLQEYPLPDSSKFLHLLQEEFSIE